VSTIASTASLNDFRREIRGGLARFTDIAHSSA
jgi:hypothetical protein